MKPHLHMRIVVVAPPAGVAFAVQRGRSELLAPSAVTSGSLIFEFSVSVTDTTQPRLTGLFTHGRPLDALCTSTQAPTPVNRIHAGRAGRRSRSVESPHLS